MQALGEPGRNHLGRFGGGRWVEVSCPQMTQHFLDSLKLSCLVEVFDFGWVGE